MKLKPRKFSGLHRRNAAQGIRGKNQHFPLPLLCSEDSFTKVITSTAQLYPRGASDPAGLDIHGELFNPDIEANFDVYKTFEMEFESSPSKYCKHDYLPRPSTAR